jgi:dGTPase
MTHASAEAQVAALADDIAYHSHDLDDGLRAKLFTMEEIGRLPVVAESLAEARALAPNLAAPRLRHETIRRVLDRMIRDVVGVTRLRIARLDPESVENIRHARSPVVGFSPAMAEANREIKEFLFARMYRHWRVNRMSAKSSRLTAELATLLLDDPSLLPDEWGERAGQGRTRRAAETVRDYIAGMTDRYAQDEYRRLTDPSVPG